jgi:general secretion pathway protein G
MAQRRTSDRPFILPWERRRSLLLRLGLGRARPFVIALAAIALCVFVGMHERRRAGERATRATLLVARRALDAFRADQAGKCPRRLDDLVSAGYLASAPTDGWGKPLRLLCPGRKDPDAYDLSSDGPDGEPGGLDRIE